MRAKRADIQGLRAAAVIGVVLFHLDASFLPGGFLGVDVFFVVSGFVIGQILFREFSEYGHVDFSSFIWKRVLRLLPVLSVVTVAVAMTSNLFFTSPLLHETVNQTAISGLVGLSNFVIAYISGGYFGKASDLNPLLHTWSLSVEWQFYFLIPLIFLVVERIPASVAVKAATLAASFLFFGLASFLVNFADLAEIAGGRVDLTGYYSSIGRFWEFSAGALAALVQKRFTPSRSFSTLLVAIGLALIASSFLFFHSGMQTPGRSTIVPVAGTVLCLLAGSQPESRPVKALSIRPLVWVGDRSYSLYLWHWPVVFFAETLGHLSTIMGKVAVVTLTLALSWASYRFVEMKATYSSWKRRSKGPALSVALFALPAIVVAGWHVGSARYQDILLSNQVVESIPGDVGHDEFHRVVAEEFAECADTSMREISLSWGRFVRCQQTSGTAPVEIAIIGDSHAEHLFYGLAKSKPETEVAYYIRGELPIPGSSEQMARILDHVANSQSIQVVVISAFWESRGIPVSEIAAVIERFVATGKRVVVTNDIPVAGDPWECKSSPVVTMPRKCEFFPTESMPIDLVNQTLRTIAAETGATFVDTYSLICPADRCSMSVEYPGQTSEVLVYRDNDHLNLLGSTFVGQTLATYVG